MKYLTGLIAIILTVASCATAPRTLDPMGGSRADGTVIMGANRIGSLRRLVVDWESTDRLAVERCEIWGFSSASRFGGVESSCAITNADNNCIQYNHRYTYQCID